MHVSNYWNEPTQPAQSGEQLGYCVIELSRACGALDIPNCCQQLLRSPGIRCPSKSFTGFNQVLDFTQLLVARVSGFLTMIVINVTEQGLKCAEHTRFEGADLRFAQCRM